MKTEDYMRVVRERWRVIVFATVLGLIGALSVFLVRPLEYTATVSLYVSAQSGSDPQQAFQGAQLSEQRVKSYNQIATGDRVLSETINRLGLRETSDELADSVTATSAVDSVIIDISVIDRSPQQAATIANTLGTVTSEVVDELERPAAPNAAPAVAVRLVKPAAVPTEPSSASLLTSLIIGIFSGLVVGAIAAFVRASVDKSVKSPESLSVASEAPNLAVIGFDPTASTHPLIVHDDPTSPRAEAFRQLRTNLQFLDIDSPRKVVLVSSSMPAEGKTTTVANLALAVAATGSRVLVVEADLRRPRLSDLLGIDRTVGLTQVLTGRTGFSSAVQPWGGGQFDLLSGGSIPPNPSELLGSNQMRHLIDDLRQHYDLVLIDSPPILPVTDAAALSPQTDGVLLVCRIAHTSTTQVSLASKSIKNVNSTIIGTILTMVPQRGPLAYSKYNSYYSSNTDSSGRPLPTKLERSVAEHEGNSTKASPRQGTPPSISLEEPTVRSSMVRRSNRPEAE